MAQKENSQMKLAFSLATLFVGIVLFVISTLKVFRII